MQHARVWVQAGLISALQHPLLNCAAVKAPLELQVECVRTAATEAERLEEVRMVVREAVYTLCADVMRSDFGFCFCLFANFSFRILLIFFGFY